MRIDKPILGKLTQGTIFTSARAEEYNGHPTWGLCITARCDMAHENKTHVFSYLPVVSFDAWLLRDGARILAERLQLELHASAANSLRSANKSSSVLDSYEIEFIASNIMKGDMRFLALAEKIAAVKAFRSHPNPCAADVLKLVKLNQKCAERLTKDLWSMQLAGYYYLKNIGVTEQDCDTGYVVLLREVHHLPHRLARKIADGIVVDDSAADIHPELIGTTFDFACPTGLIASPWIEHIMQQFSLLFSRIGLPDPDKAHLAVLNERINRDA